MDRDPQEVRESLEQLEHQLREAEAKEKLERAKVRIAKLERARKREELAAANWMPAQRNPGTVALHEALKSQQGRNVNLIEGRAHGKDLMESNFLWDWVSGYQDLIDRLRSPDGLLLSAISIAADRRYGAYWPFFRTWNELALLRGASRILYQTSAIARGAGSALKSYIIGDGFTYRAAARDKDNAPFGLRAAVQDILDQNSDLNDWPALEGEALIRDMRDGEWYYRDFPQPDGLTFTRVIDAPQLIQPSHGSLKEWSFGKKNPLGDDGQGYDVRTILAYYACYDGDNTHGEEVDAQHVIEHCANVDSDIKRGLPDLAYDTYDFLKVSGRLIENMAEGSAIQASIAQIRQWDGPVTPDQASDFVGSEADYQMVNPWTGNEYNVRQVRPGETIEIPKGMQFVPPPFSQGSPIFIQVAQLVLRAVAVTWSAPEWITSGDASNNNYASSLTAESPFVKVGTHKQNVVYKRRFLCAKWRVLRNWCKSRGGVVASGQKYDFAAVKKYIDIQCEPPSMEVRNKGEEASANAVRVQSGWKSRQTVAAEEGLEWDQEKANIEQYNDEMGGAMPPLPMPGDEGGKPPPAALPLGEAADHDLAAAVRDWLAELAREAGEPAPDLSDADIAAALGHLEEQWLREDGFSGVDRHGHQWVNGKQVKRQHQGPGGQKKGAVAHLAAVAERAKEIVQKAAPHLSEKMKTVVQGIHAKAVAKFQAMEQRYGRRGAIAVMASSVALLPVPAPGASFLPVLAAEGLLAVRRALG